MALEVNKPRFYDIVQQVTTVEHERFNIGTYQEKKLHLFMKNYFESDPACQEIPYAGYVADIKRDDCIIEIETSGFCGLRNKLAAYLPTCRVTLVYPIATVRALSWIDPVSGEISPRRKSPKKENVYDLLFQGIYILDYLSHPNLTIAGMCMEIQEYRLQDGWNWNKKRGSHRYECMPTDLYDIVSITTLADYAALLPDSCVTDFTFAQFCHGIGKSQRVGRAVLKVFQTLGLIAQTGKKGRYYLYARTPLAAACMGEQSTAEPQSPPVAGENS